MSSIPYSGGTIVNTTFAADTRALIVSGMETHLTTAGWSVISGGGTGDVLMKSAVTPASASNSIRMRFYDPGSGNCAQFTMKNDAGTITSQIHYLLAGAGKTYRIIACKYNYFVFTEGTSAAREFICGGTLNIPTFLEGVITADLGFIGGNAVSDTDSAIKASWRTCGRYGSNVGATARFSGLVNSNLVDVTGSATAGIPQLVGRFPVWCTELNSSYRWHDDSELISEALVSWGLTSPIVEGKIRGILHNCHINANVYAGDDVSVSSYDSHAWWAITNSNAGTDSAEHQGTLFVAIS